MRSSALHATKEESPPTKSTKHLLLDAALDAKNNFELLYRLSVLDEVVATSFLDTVLVSKSKTKEEFTEGLKADQEQAVSSSETSVAQWMATIDLNGKNLVQTLAEGFVYSGSPNDYLHSLANHPSRGQEVKKCLLANVDRAVESIEENLDKFVDPAIKEALKKINERCEPHVLVIKDLAKNESKKKHAVEAIFKIYEEAKSEFQTNGWTDHFWRVGADQKDVLVPILKSEDEGYNDSAFVTFRLLESPAVCQELARLLLQTHAPVGTKESCCALLHSAGKEAARDQVPALLKALTEAPDRQVRLAALETLSGGGYIGPTEAIYVATNLTYGLDEEGFSWDVRLRTVHTLGRLSEEVLLPHINAIAERLKDENPWVRQGTAEMLVCFRPEILTPMAGKLLEGLADESQEVVNALSEALLKVSFETEESINLLFKATKHENKSVRKNALTLLQRLGTKVLKPEHGELLAPLVGAAEPSPDVRRLAMYVLEACGREVMERSAAEIMCNLEHEDTGLRATAVGCLARMDPEAIKLLLPPYLSSEKSPETRAAATQLFGCIGDAAPEVIETIATFLAEKDKDLVAQSIRTLGSLGVEDAHVHAHVEAIGSHLGSESHSIREAAFEALKALGPEVALEKAAAYLTHEETSLRTAAANLLAEFGEAAKAHAPTVAKNMCNKTQDKEVWDEVRASLQALGAMGVEASKPYGKEMVECLRMYFYEIRDAGRAVLELLGPEVSLEPVLELLNGPDKDTQSYQRTDRSRETCCYLLGTFGKAAHPHVELLVAQTKHDVAHVRCQAVLALGKLGAETVQPHLDAIAALMRDHDYVVRGCAVRALGDLGQACAGYRKYIAKVLEEDREKRPRSDAALALGKLGAEDCLTSLVKSLCEDQGCDVKAAAAKAIGLLGQKAAAEALPALVHKLKPSEQYDVREACLGAITIAGSEACTPHIESIVEILESDSDDRIRSLAAKTLGDLHLKADALVARSKADEDSNVREFIANALGAFGPEATTEVASALSKMLSGVSVNFVRRTAAQAMAKLPLELAREHLGQLEDSACGRGHPEDDGDVRRAAILTLGKFIPQVENAKHYFDLLQELLADTSVDLRVRTTCMEVLVGHKQEVSPDYVPEFAATLRKRNREWYFQYAVIQLFKFLKAEAIGPDHVDLVAKVAKSSNDENVKQIAKETLEAFNSSA